MEASQQEQIGQAISELKKLYPNMSACERADLVLSNKFLTLAVNNGRKWR